MSHDFEKAHPLISKYEYSNYACEPFCPFNNFFVSSYSVQETKIRQRIKIQEKTGAVHFVYYNYLSHTVVIDLKRTF